MLGDCGGSLLLAREALRDERLELGELVLERREVPEGLFGRGRGRREVRFRLSLERREVRLGLGRGPVWKSTTEFGASNSSVLGRVAAALAQSWTEALSPGQADEALSASPVCPRRASRNAVETPAREDATLKL